MTSDQNEMDTDRLSTGLDAVISEIHKVVVGQEAMVRLMLTVYLAKGHILLEGVPGLAKSLAVETFARVVGGSFRRCQLTPDKLPGDITGTMVYNQKKQDFTYHFGPIFCNVFLADEINRASPKVQSALLQAMQEREVDVEQSRYALPAPMMVLATQNPIEQLGTYPLAEAQIDRFLVKHDVGYPDPAAEAELMVRKHTDFESRKRDVNRILTPDEVIALQHRVHDSVWVSDTVLRYILGLCTLTRPRRTYAGGVRDLEIHRYIRLGASPRATESLLALSKAHAFRRGAESVSFDDVNQCALPVLRHRILLNSDAIIDGVSPETVIETIIENLDAY